MLQHNAKVMRVRACELEHVSALAVGLGHVVLLRYLSHFSISYLKDPCRLGSEGRCIIFFYGEEGWSEFLLRECVALLKLKYDDYDVPVDVDDVKWCRVYKTNICSSGYLTLH